VKLLYQIIGIYSCCPCFAQSSSDDTSSQDDDVELDNLDGDETYSSLKVQKMQNNYTKGLHDSKIKLQESVQIDDAFMSVDEFI